MNFCITHQYWPHLIDAGPCPECAKFQSSASVDSYTEQPDPRDARIAALEAELAICKAKNDGPRYATCNQHPYIHITDPLGAALPCPACRAEAAEAERAAYMEAATDHRRLVRELDVLLNGEEGAAEQASLCDLVAQICSLKAKRDKLRVVIVDELIPSYKKAIESLAYWATIAEGSGYLTERTIAPHNAVLDRLQAALRDETTGG